MVLSTARTSRVKGKEKSWIYKGPIYRLWSPPLLSLQQNIPPPCLLSSKLLTNLHPILATMLSSNQHNMSMTSNFFGSAEERASLTLPGTQEFSLTKTPKAKKSTALSRADSFASETSTVVSLTQRTLSKEDEVLMEHSSFPQRLEQMKKSLHSLVKSTTRLHSSLDWQTSRG
jgi:hypothetical protein